MFALIVGLISRRGAVGVFMLMLIENVFPPLPSEMILPFAGYAAAQGRLTLPAAVVAGTVGSVAGAVVWYVLGRWLGARRFEAWVARYGRWLAVTPQEVRRAQAWMDRHGGVAVAVGRMLPGVRGVICIPAGVTGMGIAPFLLWCTLGSFGWSALLCGAGFLLRERFANVDRWISPAATLVFIGLFGVYLFRVLTFSGRGRRPSD